jgi:AcrR family transcriptional regulator
MDYFDEFNFSAPKKNRSSLKTLEDIVLATETLAKSSEISEYTVKNLADKAGYSKSTIFHHFKKFDDVFIYVFLIRRRKALLSIAELINHHPADAPLSALVTNMLNLFFEHLNAPPRKVLLFIVAKFFKHTQNPQLINLEADIFIQAWMEAVSRDQTDTFVKFNEFELRLRLRALQAVTRSPFFEDSATAGTSEHFEIAYDLAMSIFSPPVAVS